MTRFRVLLLIATLVSVIVIAFASVDADPYKILQVKRDASQSEIRQSYKALCLRYHPDKNIHRPPMEKRRCEEAFKEVQKAYSLIGNAESRKNYDVLSRYNLPHGSFQQRPHFSAQSAFNRPYHYYYGGNDDSFREMFHDFLRQQQSKQQSPFMTPSYGAGHPSNFFNLSRFKSIYVQKVPVSLDDLFTGRNQYELSLNATFWQKLTAAFRGGLGLVLLYQSFLFALPVMRISKLISLVLGICLFQAHIPEPSKVTFFADLKAGYKDGTKFTFIEDNFDVIFVLKEVQHSNYVRQGNDLYTSVYVTRRQAKTGTTVKTRHLDGSMVLVNVPPGSKDGTLMQLKGQGWPNRRQGGRGDLYIQVRLKARIKRK